MFVSLSPYKTLENLKYKNHCISFQSDINNTFNVQRCFILEKIKKTKNQILDTFLFKYYFKKHEKNTGSLVTFLFFFHKHS